MKLLDGTFILLLLGLTANLEAIRFNQDSHGINPASYAQRLRNLYQKLGHNKQKVPEKRHSKKYSNAFDMFDHVYHYEW